MPDENLADSLQIIHYPHPTLRHKSRPLRRVDAELLRVVRRMFDLMYEQKGIGLAANQVDLPYRLFVMNLKGEPTSGEELVFINPTITKRAGLAEAEEGCLSLPGLYADVKRAEKITVEGFDLKGQPIKYDATGLFARAVQHEIDHLDGVLFIDRISESARTQARGEIEEFEINFDSRRRLGGMLTDQEIAARTRRLEQDRT